MHEGCGIVLAEGDFICQLCFRGESLIQERKTCFEQQQKAANKMKNFSLEKHGEINVGDCIVLSVPDVDRGPLDFSLIYGVVKGI